MKRLLLSLSVFISGMAQAQNVGIGTTTPAVRLEVKGSANSPSIPGATSTGIFRIGVSSIEGIDFGKIPTSPYSGWIQAGYQNLTVDPLSLQPSGGSVGIGTTVPMGALDITSTTQGFLPPRMTLAQRNAMMNLVPGLVIFNVECDELQVYNGTIWKNIAGNAACSVATMPYVNVCSQSWMVKNLDVTAYRNGDPVLEIISWPPSGPGWCWYDNNIANAAYGRLYNWSALTDPRGLVPEGWHVPSDAEWSVLETCLGGASVAGGKLKEPGLSHWGTPNTGATNSSGFTGLGSGIRKTDGVCDKLKVIGYWWTSTEYNAILTYGRSLDYNSTNLNSTFLNKNNFASIRCIKD